MKKPDAKRREVKYWGSSTKGGRQHDDYLSKVTSCPTNRPLCTASFSCRLGVLAGCRGVVDWRVAQCEQYSDDKQEGRGLQSISRGAALCWKASLKHGRHVPSSMGITRTLTSFAFRLVFEIPFKTIPSSLYILSFLVIPNLIVVFFAEGAIGGFLGSKKGKQVLRMRVPL